MLSAHHISKTFDGNKVLRDICLDFNPEEITFIVGASGSGKTTLLNILGGMERPSEGRVEFQGQDIAENLTAYRSRHVGVVFQDYNLISGMSVSDNISLCGAISGTEIDSLDLQKSAEILHIKNMEQPAETLSGGEKQRTALLRALFKRADIILADEPTGNLDSENALSVMDMLCGMSEGKYVIIVSHDLAMAERYADRIITICDGQVKDDRRISRNATTECSPVIMHEEGNPGAKNIHRRSPVIMLGKNSVKRKLGRIVAISGTIAVAIVAVVLLLELKKAGKIVTDRVNRYYLDNDMIEMYYGFVPDAGFIEYPFDTSFQKEIEERSEVEEVVWEYYLSDSGWILEKEDREAEVILKQINLNDFFEERVMSNEIEGRFPKYGNEIIIAEDAAKELFDGDCIGEKIVLRDMDYNTTEYTVVGVNHTKNYYEEIYTYISADAVKEHLNLYLTVTAMHRLVIMETTSGDPYATARGMYGEVERIDGSETLILGNLPKDDSQILVSSAVLEYCLDLLELSDKYSVDDVLKQSITETDWKEVQQKLFAINCNGRFYINVVGVYIDNTPSFRLTDGFLAELMIPDPIYAEVYVSDYRDIQALIDDYSSENTFFCDYNQQTLKDKVTSETDFFMSVLIIIGIVLMAVSFLLLLTYSKLSVYERRKEIAVVKCLGVSDWQVLKILLYDMLVISALAVLIAELVAFLLRLILSRFSLNFALIRTGELLFFTFLTGVLFVGIVIFITILQQRNLSHKLPAEFLKE